MGGTLVQAAGGAVWRNNDGTTEVAVVHRPRYDDWSLPKGKAVRGEHPLDTARREVREETGIHPVLGPELPTQHYRARAGEKVVRFWAMSGRDGGFRPTAEVDEAVWLPVAEARTVLSHRRDVAVLDALAGATSVDAAVLLVRHTGPAPARGRPAPALDGPVLDGPAGRRARALRRLLPAFGPRRLICLPDDRRRATLAPLAVRLGLPVTYGWDRPEHAGRRRPGRGDLVRDLAADGGTTVIAAPGSMIREVMTELAGADGVALPTGRPGRGSVSALFFRRARLTDVDYYPI
jgi:8-oxo-dGTP pyrophosphatase MutT (NUDIX family)